MGHSFGAAAAAEAMRRDPRFAAGINLDGSFFGAVLDAGLNRPFLLMGHENKTRATDPSWEAVWARLTGWKREVEVRGSKHYGFSDLPRVLQVLGLGEELSGEVGEVLGTVEGGRMMGIVVTYAVAFLDMVFKGGEGEVFDGRDGRFPEVVIAE